MRADLLVKSRSLTGSSDLTLFAPLKRGLVPSLEALSYKTRTLRLLRLLQGGRVALHEHALQRPLSDAVERVARIHSFRVCVVESKGGEPEDRVMLAVTFDGTWESYIRVLWQKVGSLLDIIFCNTEGYVLSTEGFEAWCGWVHRVQVETAFFFNTHALTVDDVHWLRGAEAAQRAESDPARAALAAVRHRSETAEQIAWRAGQTTTRPALDAVRQGLQSLSLLFRMTDLYLPGTPDGGVLQRAARDLLMEFRPLVRDPDLTHELLATINRRFQRQLDWLDGLGPGQALPAADGNNNRPPPPGDGKPDREPDVQGGMLRGYARDTHGCLVLLGFDHAAALATLLARVRPLLSTEATPKDDPAPHLGIAFAFEGLRRAGLDEDFLATLPPEFREGMDARASMLGDFRANHPRRWALPQPNWRPAGAGQLEAAGQPMAMAAVHAVLQLRCRVEPGDARAAAALFSAKLPAALHTLLCTLVLHDGAADADGLIPGLRVLAVQPMAQLPPVEGTVVEHFGYADGKSQPSFVPQGPRLNGDQRRYDNHVHLGELLLGYPNEADPVPAPANPAEADTQRFLHNGSFMVVRKLVQDVEQWQTMIERESDLLEVDERLLRAKLMGRWPDGRSLIDHHEPEPPPARRDMKGKARDDEAGQDNDFNFSGDADGRQCPIHAHVRRSNPRLGAPGRGEPLRRRRARIVRRGMPFGPPFAGPGDNAERGLVFIAYNANIAEQFEVVQRWVTGGNSTGGYSGHTDPLLGVPEPGQTRCFRFELPDPGSDAEARSVTVTLDKAPEAFEAPRPLVRLAWGGYYFVPSASTLARLEQSARTAAAGAARCPWSAAPGRARLAELRALENSAGAAAAKDAWKTAIEDSQASEQLATASLWAALREQPGGVVRTPYGVLVADHDTAMEVLRHDDRFSVSGYRARMVAGKLDIYLGLDRHPLGAASRYDQLSGRINAAIGQLPEGLSFDLARQLTGGWLEEFIKGERGLAGMVGAEAWELNLDAKEVIDRVLAGLTAAWFGTPELFDGQDTEPPQPPNPPNRELRNGSWRWNWAPPQPALCPVHFTPPSRWFFQPHPGTEVEAWGQRCAAALSDAMLAFVRRQRQPDGSLALPPSILPKRADGTPAPPMPAPLAQAVFQSLPNEDDTTLANTLAGVMMGYLPTLDGQLRAVMNEWLRLGEFWALRAAWAADTEVEPTLAKAEHVLGAALRRTMQFRPVPELIWRTATQDGDRLGGVTLQAGDTVVLSLTSANHQRLAAGLSKDVYAVFGGERTAGGPTHACPGYAPAMQVLLGMLAGWMDCKQTLRPTPAPLAFTLEGKV